MWNTMVNSAHDAKKSARAHTTAKQMTRIGVFCHTGYVLSCLPFLSDGFMRAREQIELLKNLKMPPDFIINIKVCPNVSDARQ